MQNSPKPVGTFLARNTAFNVLGQLIPILVAVVTIPYVVHRLGTDRFGVLAIAWLLLGYLSLLDFGLGRATTKFIAEALARKEIDKVSELVWTSVGVQIVLGCTGALLLVPFVPLLVMKVLRVPEGLAGETRTILLMLLVSLPFVLAGNGLRAVLEALERFDLVNLLRIPATVSVYVLPAVGLLVGLHLPAIVALLVFARFVVCLAHLRFCFVAFSELRFHIPSDGALLLRMLRYGGWVTVSNAVNPVLIYLDRFLISSILSLSLLGIYTVPFEAVTKLWIVPASLSATLFPAFSALGTIQNRDRLVRLYARSFKYLLLFLGPPVVLLIVFAREILTLWMGLAFANNATHVLQILAYGVFVNCFAHVPFGVLQSLGRPDAAAKILLLELPLYIPMAWVMISRFGITGAAFIWALRVTIEALVMVSAVSKLFSLRPYSTEHGLAGSSLAVFVLGGSMAAANLILRPSFPLQVAVCAALTGGFIWIAWHKIFDNADRAQLQSMCAPLIRTASGVVPR